MSDKPDEKLKKLVDGFLRAEAVTDAGRNALALLFPKIRSLVAGEASFFLEESRQEKIRQNRLSAEQSSRHYFDLSPKGVALGKSELDSLLNNPNPEESFQTVIEKAERLRGNERSRLRRLFLEALDGAFGPDRPFTERWFEALANASPYFIRSEDEEVRLLFHIDNSQRLRWVVISGIKTVPPDARRALFIHVIEGARDLSLLCSVFRGLAGDVRGDGAKGDRATDWFGNDVREIRTALVERVCALMQTREIFRQADLSAIMWFMWGADLGNEIREYNNAAINNLNELPSLLDMPVKLRRSSEGNYEYINKKSWSEIIDLDLLKKSAEDLLKGPRDAEIRRLAQRFMAALARGEGDGASE